jgi:hypothetical protein
LRASASAKAKPMSRLIQGPRQPGRWRGMVLSDDRTACAGHADSNG